MKRAKNVLVQGCIIFTFIVMLLAAFLEVIKFDIPPIIGFSFLLLLFVFSLMTAGVNLIFEAKIFTFTAKLVLHAVCELILFLLSLVFLITGNFVSKANQINLSPGGIIGISFLYLLVYMAVMFVIYGIPQIYKNAVHKQEDTYKPQFGDKDKDKKS